MFPVAQASQMLCTRNLSFWSIFPETQTVSMKHVPVDKCILSDETDTIYRLCSGEAPASAPGPALAINGLAFQVNRMLPHHVGRKLERQQSS